jgi:hypothetical protein
VTTNPIEINVGEHLAMAAQTLETIEQKDFPAAALTALELSAIAHSLLAIGSLMFLQHNSILAKVQGITTDKKRA